jgi:hypothetical protein
MRVNEPEYLGDGVYATWDGSSHILLYISDGMSKSNVIALDKDVRTSLFVLLKGMDGRNEYQRGVNDGLSRARSRPGDGDMGG